MLGERPSPGSDNDLPGEVFVDTSGIYAALASSDANHAEAGPLFDRLLSVGAGLVTTSYVVLETATLAQARLGMEAAHAFLGEIVPVLDVAWVDGHLHQRGVATLLGRSQRNLSLTDAVSFEVMRELALTTAFSFDRHFEDAGFELL